MTKEEFEALISRAVNNFDDRDYFSLMEAALNRVDPKFDKRAGSMVWNGNAPSLAEVAQLYTALDFVFNATYVRTAPREYLIKRAADRSITPTPATNAIYTVLFSTLDGSPVPRGTRFSAEELNFEVITWQRINDETGKIEENPENGELRDNNSFQLIRCETVGTVGNSSSGQQLIPIDYVPGLGAASVGAIYTLGEDEEDTETFRERVLEAMRSIAFAGNQADYKEKILEIDGIGQCKVYPVWNSDVPPSVLQGTPEIIYNAKETVSGLLDGDVKDYLTALLNAAENGKLTVGGTVRIVIASTNTQAPALDDAKVEEVKNIIDPTGSDGEGKGLAPIGHVVTIVSADEDEISVEMDIVRDPEYSQEAVLDSMSTAVGEYFATLAKTWSKHEHIKISRAFIIYKVMQDAQGVVDIDPDSVKIKGAAQDYELDKDAVPVLGVVTCNE